VLDVQQNQIDRVEPFVRQSGMQRTLSVQREMQPEPRLQPDRQRTDEGALQHRLAAGERDAAGSAQEARIGTHFGCRLHQGHPPAGLQPPGIGVVAILAAEQAAAHEVDEPHPGPIHRPRRFHRMQET
jgi:hypothetical protein